MKRISIAIAAALLFSVGGMEAYGSAVLGYTDTKGGNQSFNGDLALFFSANQDISITALGVFDSGKVSTVPVGTTLYVGIYALNPNVTTTVEAAGVSPIASVTFDNAGDGGPYTLTGSDLFQSISAVALAPGNYEVVATGFSTSSSFKDGTYYGSPGAANFSGGSYLSNDGSGYIGYVISPPGGLQYVLPVGDNNVSYSHFDAGTFEFIPTPEPGTLLLMGTGVLGLAGVVRRKFRKIVS